MDEMEDKIRTAAMRVFVTGGTGFTGSHLTKRLVKDNHDVRALARHTSNTETLEKLGVDIIRGDITDRDIIFDAIKVTDWVFNIKKEPPIYRRRIAFFKKNRAFSIEKAKKILGYHPKIDLKTGISLTAKWYI